MKQKMNTKDMVMIGMFAAVMAVISQISLPMPSGVPVTIQVFGIGLIGVVLGSRRGFLSVLVYILLGAVGLPIFANFRGGLSVIVGTSGGYILSWLIMVFLCGIEPKGLTGWPARLAKIALAVAGLMAVEFLGGLQWYLLTRGGENSMAYTAIMAYSFVAFIPKDTVLTVLSVIVGEQVRKLLKKSGIPV